MDLAASPSPEVVPLTRMRIPTIETWICCGETSGQRCRGAAAGQTSPTSEPNQWPARSNVQL